MKKLLALPLLSLLFWVLLLPVILAITLALPIFRSGSAECTERLN